MLITINNDGENIKSTNYWDTDIAENGYFYASVNAGCVRLLIPAQHEKMLYEMMTAKYIIISKGQNASGKKMVEIMFEDHSSCPFSLQLSVEQFDMVPKDGKEWQFKAFTKEAGEILTLKCKVRTVKDIPCLKEW